MMKAISIYLSISLLLVCISGIAQDDLPSKIKTKDGKTARDPIATIGGSPVDNNLDYSKMIIGTWRRYKAIIKHNGVKETKTDMDDTYHFYRDGRLISEFKDLNNKKIYSNSKYIVNGRFVVIDSGNDFSEPEKSKIIELNGKTLIIYSIMNEEDDEDSEEIWDYFIRL